VFVRYDRVRLGAKKIDHRRGPDNRPILRSSFIRDIIELEEGPSKYPDLRQLLAPQIQNRRHVSHETTPGSGVSYLLEFVHTGASARGRMGSVDGFIARARLRQRAASLVTKSDLHHRSVD
jgi:hypothetical protein